METVASFREPERRHGLLRVIAWICSFIGGVLLVLGTLLLAFAIYAALVTTSPPPPAAPGGFGRPPANVAPLTVGLGATLSAFWALGILVGGLQFLAAGALFRLMIQLEENTRATARLLDRVRTRLEPVEDGAGSMFIA
jgi:hypothetical protein